MAGGYQLTRNDGPHHLHGGTQGFSHVVWRAEPVATGPAPAVKFTHRSPDGDQGYPGGLEAAVVYTLTDENELRIDATATTDRPTLVNLTHHSYFNLAGAGSGDVLGHVVCDRWRSLDARRGTGLAFGRDCFGRRTRPTTSRSLCLWAPASTRPEARSPVTTCATCSIMRRERWPAWRRLANREEAAAWRFFTTEPAIVLYTANYLDGSLRGKGGAVYGKHAARVPGNGPTARCRASSAFSLDHSPACRDLPPHVRLSLRHHVNNFHRKNRGPIVSKISPALCLLAGACMFIAAAGATAGEPTAAESPLAQAQWIAPPANAHGKGPLPLFRKEFSLAAKPVKATLRIVGLGDYDARVNGKRLADTGINQPWSQYEKTIYYRDFDITSLVQPGANCVGVMLGNSFWHNPNPPTGRYNKPGPQRTAKRTVAALCGDHSGACRTARFEPHRHRRDLADQAGSGRVLARLCRRGLRCPPSAAAMGQPRAWTTRPGSRPALCRPRPAAGASEWPPFKAQQRFAPTSVKQTAPGVFLYSFPQNCSAQLRVELSGRQSPATRSPSAAASTRMPRIASSAAMSSAAIWSRDGQPLVHQWVSFYLGMQFVEVSGAVPEGHANPGHLPVIHSMELVHVRTALPEVGTFACSSAFSTVRTG